MSLLGAGTTDAAPMLLSLPVIVNREVRALSGVVLDRSAVVSAVGPVNVAVDNSVFFTSDSVALRATWRIGFNVVRPDRIAKFTVTARQLEHTANCCWTARVRFDAGSCSAPRRWANRSPPWPTGVAWPTPSGVWW